MANLAYFTVCVKGSKEACELIRETTFVSEIFGCDVKKKEDDYIYVFDGEAKWDLEAYVDKNLYPEQFDISNPNNEVLSKMSMQNKSRLLNVDIEYWSADIYEGWYNHCLFEKGEEIICDSDDLYEIEGIKIDEDYGTANFKDLLVLTNNNLKKKKTVDENFICNPDDYEIQDGVLICYNGNDKYIKTPEGIKIIEEEAFMQTTAKKIIISEGVELVRGGFDNIYNTIDIHFPSTLKRLEDGSINCSDIKHISIPETCECDETTFYGCDFLKVERYKI